MEKRIIAMLGLALGLASAAAAQQGDLLPGLSAPPTARGVPVASPRPEPECYHGAHWQCQNGSRTDIVTPRCLPLDFWWDMAGRSCDGLCSRLTGKCGGNRFAAIMSGEYEEIVRRGRR